MIPLTLAVRDLAVQYGRRLVFRDLSFDIRAGQCLGVTGPNGAGKTTLLRTIAGCLSPAAGEVRINGLVPADALARTDVAYFAGEVTLPGFVRASAWGSLGTGDTVTPDRRRLRALSRGSRQLLGLRTVLGRAAALVVLDEPWEGLDPDAARWLSTTLELKRDHGAAVLLASHRLNDLASVCDAFLLLMPQGGLLVQAHEIAPVGHVTPGLLIEVFDRLRGGPPPPYRADVSRVDLPRADA